MSRKQPLVLLPGSLSDEEVWVNQVPALSDIADIRIPHLMGFDSLDAIADAVLADAPETFALAGFSMGGRVALEVFRRAPERVTRLALIDASVHPIAEGEAEKRQPLLNLAMTEGMEALADAWLPRIVHPSRLDDTPYMARLKAMACRFTPEDYVDEVRALLTRPDARPVMAMIHCPTLILAGEADPLSTPARNAEMAGMIPHARLAILKDCSHFPMLEKPDETNAALCQWLLDEPA